MTMMSQSSYGHALGVGGYQSFPLLTNLNVTVPSKYLGIHAGRVAYDPTTTIPSGIHAGLPYPAEPTIPFSYDYVRSHDSAPGWRTLHTASNTFDAAQLAILDRWVDYFYSRGKRLIYTIYQTPQWAAATTPNFTDPYGAQYGANPPSDLGSSGSAYLAQFVTMLVNRYNSGGNHKLWAIEVWNEPIFSQLSGSFFTGTYVQMAQMAKTVYNTAKAIDSTLLVGSPSFVGSASFVSGYLAAAVGDGTYGAAYQDFIGAHFYDFSFQASTYSTNAWNDSFINGVLAYKATTALPIYEMETGWIPYATWSVLPDTIRANLIKQKGLLQAAGGVKSCVFYLVDGGYFKQDGTLNPTYQSNSDNTGNLYGGPLSNTTISNALQWVANLAGITIYELGYQSGGGYYANTSAGLLTTV